MTETNNALRLADMIERYNAGVMSQKIAEDYIEAAAELRRLHAENERLSCLCDKWNSECDEFREDNKRLAAALVETQQECAALARTVMLDQVSFDRKPDCYGIRQITDDEGVEEWEDIRTSPDVAREEANDMMATGRGEIYEVVPLWTTPQHSPTAQAADSAERDAEPLIGCASPPTAQAEGWVSVADRLPDPFCEVIVYPRPSDYCCEASVDTKGQWSYIEYETGFGVNHCKCKVTHWKPMGNPQGAAKGAT